MPKDQEKVWVFFVTMRLRGKPEIWDYLNPPKAILNYLIIWTIMSATD
jgi:hypothetical protein